MAKKKPCDFCEDDWSSDYLDHPNGYCAWYDVYPFNNLMVFTFQANGTDGELQEDFIEVTMNYCPVCGRKLI